jgi:hypothetical protein
MADVKIVDIDNVQWNMKDQEARNKIITLETKTNINEKILNQKGESYISLVTINDKKFIHLRFKGDFIISEIGQKLFNIGVIEGLTGTISVITDLTRVDKGGRYPAVTDITTNGDVEIFPILPNQISGGISSCMLYGDCFTMIS